MLLSSQLNALVIITGDFNSTTTGLKTKDITQRNHLKQLVNFKARNSGTLDWFMTNRPKVVHHVSASQNSFIGLLYHLGKTD